MTLDKELTDVEADIANRRGSGITTLFDQQIDTAEHHLKNVSAANVGELAKDFSLENTNEEKLTSMRL